MLMLKKFELTRFVVLGVALFLTATSASTLGQTPIPTPAVTPNPVQRDATRAPGTETQNPNTPPGTQQAPPNTAPGAQQPPAQAPPGAPTAPTTTPTQPPATSTTEPTPVQEPREPNLPVFQQSPVPPVPDMSRLGVTADNALPLSLNDAIKRALENNSDIEVARDDVRIAETQLRALEGIYDPIFSLTPQIDNRITPQQNVFSGLTTAGTISSTTYSIRPAVTKFVSPGGGQYEFSYNNTKTKTNSTANIFNPIYAGNLGVTFTQPLWRNRPIDNNRRQIRIQKVRLQQSDADFRLQTIQIITQVQQAYWQLVFALRDQQNQLANLNLSRENLKNTEAQIAAGVKAPLERAEVQTELANRESTLLLSVQNVSIAENNLKRLIFKDPTASEWTAQLTPTDTPKFDMAPVNLPEALKAGQENRPELRRLRLQNDISTIDLKYFKNQSKPQLDLTGTLATTGLAGTPVPRFDNGGGLITPPANLIGGNGKMLSNLFGFETRNIVVGVTLSFPFRNRTAEANLAGALIQQQQLEASIRSQEQLVEVDVRNAAQAVETSRRRVLTARVAQKNAEMQLEGERRLYQVGRSTTFLLFQRENTLANARTQELQAETDYNKALADLQRATSTTLGANSVVVEPPVK